MLINSFKQKNMEINNTKNSQVENRICPYLLSFSKDTNRSKRKSKRKFNIFQSIQTVNKLAIATQTQISFDLSKKPAACEKLQQLANIAITLLCFPWFICVETHLYLRTKISIKYNLGT